jgi:hypothetical protein
VKIQIQDFAGRFSVECPYCNKPAVLRLSSAHLYHGRDYGPVWQCLPCEAWVGTHKDSKGYAPLGRLANAELRMAKMAAHAVFDPIWESLREKENIPRNTARRQTYFWLSQQLGIAIRDCHIGMFDVEQCKRVVEICENQGAIQL